MMRAGHMVLNGLTGLSLLVAVLVAVMWVRSYGVAEAIEHWDAEALFSQDIQSKWGRILFYRIKHSRIPPQREGWSSGVYYEKWTSYAPMTDPETFLGFHWRFTFPRPLRRPLMLIIPDWFILTVTGVLPLVRLFRHLGRQRLRASGQCATCGYDLMPSPRPVIVILPDEQPPTRPR